MVVVEAVDGVEVVSDEEKDDDPLEAPWSLHPEDHHKTCEFHEEQWLQDRVIAKQPDGIVVLIQLCQVGLDLFCSRVDADSFLEAMVHQWQPRHEKVLLRAHIRVNFGRLVVARVHVVGYSKALRLSLSTIYAASLASELAVHVSLDTERLLAILLQELTLIPHIFLSYKLCVP